MIGSVIDARYEILERISEGGFFTVYKAHDRVVDRTVSVKLLFPRYADSPDFAAKLRSEVTAASTLEHRAIARVYETSEANDTTYVATEFVPGGDLKERIRHTAPMPLSEAVDIAMQSADALSYAHRAGVIHGDVTPYTILVTPELDVKLCDFGVNRAAIGSQFAQSNAVMRGVHYLAPEVAEGAEPTASSDIYALGVVLFEMLTGALPYQGDTPLAVALKHAQDPVPSPRTLNPSVPKALEGIVMRALSKDPAGRYPSMLAMLQDLRRAQECIRMGRSLAWSPLDAATTANGRDMEETPKSGRRDGWNIATTVLLSIVAVLLGGMVLFFFTSVGRPPDVTVPEIIGKPLAEAEEMLRQTGLRMKVAEESYDPTVPAGSVMNSMPEPGRLVKKGREIRVTLSRGQENVTMPNVVNASLAEARRVLQQAGMEVGTVTHEYSDVVPKGHVMIQQPAGEEQAPRGTKVALTLSNGAYVAPGTEIVPPESSDPRPSAPETPTTTTPAQPTPQRWEVSVEVPQGGPEQQEVRVVVVQDGKETEAYKQQHPSGAKLSTSVETTGSALIRVFVNDQLLREEQVGGAE